MNGKEKKSEIPKFGIGVAILFYVSSLVYVLFLAKSVAIINPNVKTLTITHWQLEDGFREGIDVAIKRFEELKAKQGIKVKIIQSTVPYRGYEQWLTTQFIGGNPVDIVELAGSEDLKYQYVHSLTPYIGKPNPFNKGTLLEGIPWKDTVLDEMRNSVSPKYQEYFGVGTSFFVFRVYFNLDLLEKATGTRKIPEPLSLTEWLEMSEKLRKYGEKTGELIIPIGVRGIDRGTLRYLMLFYFSMLNHHLNDDFDRHYNCKIGDDDVFKGIKDGAVNIKRYLAMIDILKEIGQYFGKGFTSMDSEQLNDL